MVINVSPFEYTEVLEATNFDSCGISFPECLLASVSVGEVTQLGQLHALL